ncbi:MAG: hypothetical protein LC620_03680 [Halobacteriales archaeon]|nr:hypothetical protein [Halobacteriales archaeon]
MEAPRPWIPPVQPGWPPFGTFTPGWAPPPPEPDTFWGPRAVRRMPSVAAQAFFGRPRPPPERSLLLVTTGKAWRFGLTLFGCGFLGALLYQLTGLGYLVPSVLTGFLPTPLAILVSIVFSLAVALQIFSILQGLLSVLALGAPLFEEFFKVGLALLVCAPLSRFARGWTGAPVYVMRLTVAAAVGALFGWSEHFLYASEDARSYLFRVVFHTGSAALSMTAYTVLERNEDPRTRWFTTIPSSLLHYGNNGFGPFIALFAGERAGEAWSVTMAVGTVASIPVVMTLARPLSRLAARQVARHFGRWAPPVRAVPAG